MKNADRAEWFRDPGRRPPAVAEARRSLPPVEKPAEPAAPQAPARARGPSRPDAAAEPAVRGRGIARGSRRPGRTRAARGDAAPLRPRPRRGERGARTRAIAKATGVLRRQARHRARAVRGRRPGAPTTSASSACSASRRELRGATKVGAYQYLVGSLPREA